MIKWLERFVTRLVVQLNIVNGIASIAGLIFAVGGALSAGSIRKALFILAAAILVPTIGVAIYHAWPPALRSPQDVVGQRLFVSDLDSLDPPVPKLGIIGHSRVGKTTLRDLLLQEPYDAAERTSFVTARVSSIIQNPATYFAVLDGRGEAYAHQFEVADAADILCVLLDHNLVQGEIVSDERIKNHRDFGQQLRERLRATWSHKKPQSTVPVHILLNKRDEWSKASAEEQAKLYEVLRQEEQAWTSMPFVGEVSTSPHSNADAEDVVKLIAALKQLWNSRRPT